MFGSFSAKQRAADNEKIIRANEQLQKSVQEMRTSLSSLKETVELMNSVMTQFVAQKVNALFLANSDFEKGF